jgi:hypothetical protein
MTNTEKYEWVLGLLDAVEPYGDYAKAFCPAHNNTETPALSVKKYDNGVAFKCHGAGCTTEEICAALGIRPRDLFVEARDKKVVALKSVRGGLLGCTVEDYAKEKKLPEEWLKRVFALRDMTKHPRTGAPAMVIPYLDEEAQEIRTRYRTALSKPEDGADQRFSWKSGSKADTLYGLEQLPKIREKSKYVILVEGESDVHTLRYHNFPALGFPGANAFKALNLDVLEGVERVFIIVEQGDAGQRLAQKLGELAGDRLRLVDLGEHDDPSGLHLDCEGDTESFKERFTKALQESTSFVEEEKIRQNQDVLDAWNACKELAESENITAAFAETLRLAGLAGEERLARILYLAMTSRLLEKPVSIAVKGPSSGGKSYIVERVLKAFPESAFFALTAMSERALIYLDENMRYRFLVIFEASGMAGDMQTYLMRSLLSENRIRYQTVEATREGTKPRLLELEGPTGLIVTTTQTRMHAENETRLLSLTVTDTQEQTKAVFEALADEDREPEDLETFRALQVWIGGQSSTASVPYAKVLADLVPPVAVRMRRDFRAVLQLVRAHAILHQASRVRDDKGRVVATIIDYAVVRELVADLVSEGVDATVSKTVREAVDAVTRLIEDGDEDHVGLKVLSKELGIDRGSASRRVKAARDKSYLVNTEETRGKPLKLVPGDPMPPDLTILPTREELEAANLCTFADGSGGGEGDSTPDVESVAIADCNGVQRCTGSNEENLIDKLRNQSSESADSDKSTNNTSQTPQFEIERGDGSFRTAKVQRSPEEAATQRSIPETEGAERNAQKCIHDFPGKCWLCRKKESEAEQSAVHDDDDIDEAEMRRKFQEWGV